MLVLTENAREHLLRILLDWPRLFDLEVNHGELQLVTKLVNEMKAALFDGSDAFSLNSQLQPDIPRVATLIAELKLFLQEQVLTLDVYNLIGLYCVIAPD